MSGKGLKISDNYFGIKAVIASMCDAKRFGGNNDGELTRGREKGLFLSSVDSISGNTFIFKGNTYDENGCVFNQGSHLQSFAQSNMTSNNFDYLSFSNISTIYNQNNDTSPFGNYTSVGNTSGFSNVYDDKIIQYANKYGLEPNMIKAIIATESGFNPNAKSATNDYGLMQLNAKYNGIVLDVDENIDKGCKIYSDALTAFNGDKTKALIAYNQGITGAKRTLSKGISETNYSQKVLAHYNTLNNSEKFGIVA